MNSKPKSWAALKKSVEAAEISAMPSAKPVGKLRDKLILICIAEAGSNLGVGARPGNALLERASGLRWSQCHEHILLLKKAGMIERREDVGGRGLASVYRIVWNHPVFPDHSPNGREWYIEKPSGLQDKNPPVSSEKPSGLESETLRFEAGNHPGSDVKPSGLEAKPSGRRPEHIRIPSEEQPNPIPTERLGWKAFVEKPGNTPTELDGSVEGRLLPELEALLSQLGERVTSELIWLWRDKRDLPLDGYRGNRWKAFLDEGRKTKLIAQAKENAKREKSRQQIWWETNTPEGLAAFAQMEEAQQKAGERFMELMAQSRFEGWQFDQKIADARGLHWEIFQKIADEKKAKGPAEPEVSLEETMRILREIR